MARVTTPFGKTLEVTEPVALAYYRREEGYTVDDGAAPAAEDAGVSGGDTPPNGDQSAGVDVPPHENASLEAWVEYAAAHGDAEAHTKTRNELRDEYKAAHPAT